MKFWFGQRGWGWRLWGVSYGDQWFIGLSIKQPAAVPVRVTWAEFWIAQGDWETANDYAAFEKAERWLLAQQQGGRADG